MKASTVASMIVRGLVCSLSIGSSGIAAEVACGTVGQTHVLTSGQSGHAHLKGSEEEACEAALNDLAPDYCAGCPEGQFGCLQAHVWSGVLICETHLHPDGRWSAEVYPLTTVKVFIACEQCLVETP
jgi:hypothetical protein